jgi:hypothetical protein
LPKLFVKVKTTVVVKPLSIELAPNTLVNTGITGSTRRHWLVMPLIKLLVVTLAAMLVNGVVAALVAPPATHTALLPSGVVWPGTLVTLTVILQVCTPPEASATPMFEALMVLPAALTLTLPLGMQVLLTVVLANCKPLGKVSTKLAIVEAVAPTGLVMVNVRSATPPAVMTAGLNALVTVGRGVMVNGALAGRALLAVMPLVVVCNAPVAMVLVYAPDTLPVTLAVMVQLPGVPPGMVPPAL